MTTEIKERVFQIINADRHNTDKVQGLTIPEIQEQLADEKISVDDIKQTLGGFLETGRVWVYGPNVDVNDFNVRYIASTHQYHQMSPQELQDWCLEKIQSGLHYGASIQHLNAIARDKPIPAEIQNAIDALMQAGKIKVNTAVRPDGSTVDVSGCYIAC